jgi:hypothetical protein
MSVSLSFIGGAGWQFFTNDGTPLAGGKIYTYAAGTTTPQSTYTSRSGLTLNANPIILDSAGRTPEQIWATQSLLYKYVVATADDVVIRTWDNISGNGADYDLSVDLANTTDNAKGDALIGFKQANASGFLPSAVSRTVNAKLQEYVSVKDFGAVGDGVVDDTAAIQSAINYANSTALAAVGTVSVLFPAGSYKTTSGLTVDRNIRFIGNGWPIIKVAHNGDAITLTGIPSAFVFPRNITVFDGLVFNTAIGSTPASIIRLGTASGATPTYVNSINDVRVVNCVFDQITATHVIDNNRGFGLVITGCAFTSITATSAIKMRQTNSEIPYWTYAVSIYATDFTNIVGKAIEADGGDLAVYGSIIEGCSQGAVEVGINTAYTGAQPTSFYGVYFEANQIFHYKANNGRVISNFNGCKFVKGSSLSTTLIFTSSQQVIFTGCSSPNQAPTITGGNITFSGCNYMQGTITTADSITTDRNIAYTATPTTAVSFNGSDGYKPYVFAGSPGPGGGGIVMMCSHSGFPAASNSVTQVFMVSKRLSGTAVDAVSLGRYENGDTTTFAFGVDASGYLTVTASQAGFANYALISQSKYQVSSPG